MEQEKKIPYIMNNLLNQESYYISSKEQHVK